MKIRSTIRRTSEKEQLAADVAMKHLAYKDANESIPVFDAYVKAIAILYQLNESDLLTAYKAAKR